MTLAKVAAEFAGAFERRERNNGDKFVCLADGSPEWMTDVVRAGHGDMFPDDWRYQMISNVADEIAEVLAEDADADLSEASYERIDSLIPVYNADRLQWVSSSLYRAAYVDEAMSEGLGEGGDLFTLLAYGIDREYREIWDAMVDALQEEADNRDS